MNMFSVRGLWTYRDRPLYNTSTDKTIAKAGTPNASGKQLSIPKQWTSALMIGLKNLPMIDPLFMQKYCIEK
jgi:hypothetical protein